MHIKGLQSGCGPSMTEVADQFSRGGVGSLSRKKLVDSTNASMQEIGVDQEEMQHTSPYQCIIYRKHHKQLL